MKDICNEYSNNG